MRNYNKLLALKCHFLLLCEIFMQETDNCVYLGVQGNPFGLPLNKSGALRL